MVKAEFVNKLQLLIKGITSEEIMYECVTLLGGAKN